MNSHKRTFYIITKITGRLALTLSRSTTIRYIYLYIPSVVPNSIPTLYMYIYLIAVDRLEGKAKNVLDNYRSCRVEVYVFGLYILLCLSPSNNFEIKTQFQQKSCKVVLWFLDLSEFIRATLICKQCYK